jgi:solute:Na+ symporter, SSS family
MTSYDYGVLVFYFAFMLAISWVFRHFVTNVSDYFRSGGKALWWMVGGSAFMVQFSAWTFTGAASKAYLDGWPIIAIFLGNVLGFVVNALFFAPRVRQLRVVTGIEAIRLRFGRASEQFFTWLQIPFGLLQAGIWLYSLGVFFVAIFGASMVAVGGEYFGEAFGVWLHGGGVLTLTIVVTGAVVVVMALIGGSWAVIASDFIQVMILMPVCLAVTVLALVKIGGVGAFIEQVPAHHVDFGQIFSKEFLLLWCVAMFLKQLHTTNNLADANRYLSVKDGRHARKAGFVGATLFLVGILIWFVPPMVAAILFPDLRPMFPTLKNPEEAAFIAIARDVMPLGMMGLLVSGIFAATMSSMDSGLNKNTGFFIKNFYQPVLRPHATDLHLLTAGKLTTGILGVLIVVVALKMSHLRELSLFLWTQRVSILIGIPIIVPLFLGLFVKNTPPWSAWSTVAVGFLSSLFITSHLTPEWAAKTFGLAQALDPASREYWRQSIELFGNVTVCATWFLGTKFAWANPAGLHVFRGLWLLIFAGCVWLRGRELDAGDGAISTALTVLSMLALAAVALLPFAFFRNPTAGERERVTEFFRRLNTPVDFAKEEGAHNANDARQESVVGWLCFAYGLFIALLALIPNPPLGRLAFVGCGAVVGSVGVLLLIASRRTKIVS